MTGQVCGQCGGSVIRKAGGRPPKWCSQECRWKASRGRMTGAKRLQAAVERLLDSPDRHRIDQALRVELEEALGG